MTAPVLLARGLRRTFGRRSVVDGVDLRVEAREVYAFLGPNGAGKTTTMRLILGLMPADAGTIELFGEPSSPRTRARVGGIIESPRLYPYLSALENLRIFSAYCGGAKDAALVGLLDLVGLRLRGEDRAGEFSLGMKQRLGIAIALLGDPGLLLLDEPANGLDPAGIVEMRELIHRLRDERGLAVLVSSHLLGEVERICDRVGILHGGRMVVEGRPQDLLSEGQQLEEFFLAKTGAVRGGQIG